MLRSASSTCILHVKQINNLKIVKYLLEFIREQVVTQINKFTVTVSASIISGVHSADMFHSAGCILQVLQRCK